MSTSWRKLRSEIKDVTERFDNIILMVSGGVDSMFMMDLVLRSIDNTNVTVAHFQHGIRPTDHEELSLVESKAEELDVRFIYGKGEGLKDSRNQECKARDQRWAFVEQYLHSLSGTSVVLTAHHFDDQIESFFMNSVRGRRTTELVMKPLVDFGTYHKYKPLLNMTKELIYKQMKYRRQTWIEDVTNTDTHVNSERNFWRNVLLPQIKQIRNINRSMNGLISDLSSL